MNTTVTLYTKPGCHLCEAVEQVLTDAQRSHRFDLIQRNILDDPADQARYSNDIPVVFVNRIEIARHRLTAEGFQKSIQQATECGIVVFARAPIPGKVMTRLIPTLSAEQAAAVHRAFLRHVLGRLVDEKRPITLCLDADDASSDLKQFQSEFPSLEIAVQVPGDLGHRLTHAAAEQFHRYDRVLFLTTDSPDFPTYALHELFRQLPDRQVLLAPLHDGGFWALGFHKSIDLEKLLTGIAWSTGRESSQLLARAESLNYSAGLAPQWDDVDYIPHLQRLLTRLSTSHDPRDQSLYHQLATILPDALLPGDSSV